MYYVYIHRKASTGEVFYVGKGYGDRAYSKRGRSKRWQHVVNKHGYIVDVVVKDIQEWYAFELEIEMILLYGRKDKGNGTLINMTDGGEGVSGRRCTEETRQKISTSHKGKTISQDTRKKLSLINTGQFRSEEHRCNIGKSTKSRWANDSYKEKIKESKRHLMKPVIRSDGVVFESAADASHSMSVLASHITEVCHGKRKTAYGYVWKFYE